MPDLTPRQQAEQIVDGWIRGGVIPGERREQFIQTLAGDDKVANAFAGGFMRRNQYSEQIAEAAELKRRGMEEVEAEKRRVSAEAERLRSWQSSAETEIRRLQALEAKLPTVEAELAAYRQLARDHSIDDKVTYQPPTVPAQAGYPGYPQGQLGIQYTQNPQSNGGGDYLGREEAGRYIRELVMMQGQALKISNDHQRLFGQPLDDDIISEALAANQDPKTYWENKYNVSAKRAEIDARARADERARMEAEIRAQVMSELSSNPGAVVGLGNALGVAEKSLVFDTYVRNRMDQFRPAAQPAVQGQAPPAVPPQSTKPEQIPPMAAQYSRVQEAARDFNSNFSLDGKLLPGSTYLNNGSS